MTSKALHSCFLCRRGKRRCDKSLPSCQLCTRKGWTCTYPQRRGQRSASPHNPAARADSVHHPNLLITKAPLTRVEHQAAPSTTSSSAVNIAIKFLAPDLFRELSLEIPRANLDVPEDVIFNLGDRDRLRETALQFFQITWMPIISRKRYFNVVLNPLSPLRRPTSLLALCMKLCCLEVRDDGDEERTSLYRLVKIFYSEIERTEDLCIQVLQAGILMAIFEIGDAIYPAAYLTVGACARYGVAMGLDKINQDRISDDHNRSLSWMDIEERRRAWWGVLILDRSVIPLFLNVANPSRVLATEDPKFEDFLPVDDERFADAALQPEHTVTISQGFVFKIGHFGRLAQATYLISQVLDSIRSRSIMPDYLSKGHLPANIGQLCRTIEALVRANEMEITARRLSFCCQSLVSYSGLFLLQQHIWEQLNVKSTEEAQKHMFAETQSAIDTLCRIALALQQGSNLIDLMRGQCTFFLVGVVYQGLLALMTIGQGNPSAEIRDTMTTLSWLLEHIRGRWPLAGVYKSILDAKEAILAAEVI